MELISDGAIAGVDAGCAEVTSLGDLLGRPYLAEGKALAVRFPFEEEERARSFLKECTIGREIGHGKESARLSFSPAPRARTVFPYPFGLMLAYEAVGAGFRIRYDLGNTGDAPMPYALSVALPMRCPLAADEEAADYALSVLAEGTGERGAVHIESRKTGRGLEISWEGLPYAGPRELGKDPVLRFGGKAEPLAPMAGRRGTLSIALL